MTWLQCLWDHKNIQYFATLASNADDDSFAKNACISEDNDNVSMSEDDDFNVKKIAEDIQDFTTIGDYIRLSFI